MTGPARPHEGAPPAAPKHGTTARGQRAQAEIMDAALEHALAVGPEHFSLREVARKAGYAPSALYNHFGDREELIAAIAMRSVRGLGERLSEVPGGPAPQRLLALGSAYLQFASDQPAAYSLIFDCLRNPAHPWEAYVAVAEPFTMIVSTCADGLADGSLVDAAQVGASGMAYGLWALLDGHVHLTSKHLAEIRAPFGEFARAALQAFITGITAR